MKRNLRGHPKVVNLTRELQINLAAAIGYLWLFWDWVASYAMNGDVGRWSDIEIAAGAEWPAEDGERFVKALVKCRFIDEDTDPRIRLRVHDWHENAPDWLKKRLTRKARSAASGDDRDTDGGQRQPTADDGSQRLCIPLPSIPLHSPPVITTPSAGGASSSARFDHRVEAEEVFNALPERVQRKKNDFRNAYADAIGEGATRQTILGALLAYYASHEGSGKHFREPANFIEQDGFNEPPETWAARADLNGKASAGVKAVDLERARMKARRPAEVTP